MTASRKFDYMMTFCAFGPGAIDERELFMYSYIGKSAFYTLLKKVGYYMATKKIGKLTYKFSPDGLLFRWGDEGEVKRVNLGPLNKLMDRGNGGDGGYPDDGYDDRGYDDGYDTDPYDDRYDDRDSRYDDRYDDRRDDRYDDSYGYDDRRGGRYNEYDDGYDDEPYYEPGYEDDAPPSRLDVIWDLLDRYPWIVYVLLVLLPPLGIYLLWRKGMFDFTIRTAISVVSGIWFVVLIIWLISGLTGGASDPTTQQNPTGINLASPTATIAVATTDEPLADPTTEPVADPSALPDASTEPSPTALVNTGDTPGITTEDTTGGYVFSPTTGAYYHKTSTCSSIGTAAVTQVALEVAQSRNQSQCPTCYGSTTYYMNDGGKYYHSNSTCTNMTSAEACTKEVAVKAGKTPCPDCIREFYISSASPYYHSKSNCSGITNASQTTINSATGAGKTACPTCVGTAKPAATAAPGKDYSKPSNKHDAGVTVYAKKGGSNYHRSSTCTGSGMTGGQKITLYNAIDLGYTACKHCLPDGNNTVYCDQSGSKYHSSNSCSAAKNVVKTSLGKALAVGADKCSKCWGSSTTQTPSNVTASGPKVYITDDNDLYHTKKSCNGMKDPTKIALSQALAMGKDACKDCAGQANKTVYATSGSAVYHYSSSCSKLTGKVSKATLARALADELTACSTCVNNDSSNNNTNTENSTQDEVKDKSGISVYITASGKNYHSSTSCTELGAEEYYKVSLGTADSKGKDPCKKCCATASHKVYSSATDKRYHFNKNCSLLPGTVKSASLARALMDGLKACPACTSNDADDDKASISATPAPDVVPLSESKSGKKVYVTQSGKNYHINKNCSKISTYEIKGVSLETAKNYSLSACSTCSDVAKTKVYGNDGSKYYHTAKTCEGVKNENSGTLEAALLAGMKACPVCFSDDAKPTKAPEATKKPDNTNNEDDVVEENTANGSTKVWIDLSDNSEVYHRTSKCSAIDDGVGVTLNYVLDMDFDPCPKCDPPTKAD